MSEHTYHVDPKILHPNGHVWESVPLDSDGNAPTAEHRCRVCGIVRRVTVAIVDGHVGSTEVEYADGRHPVTACPEACIRRRRGEPMSEGLARATAARERIRLLLHPSVPIPVADTDSDDEDVRRVTDYIKARWSRFISLDPDEPNRFVFGAHAYYADADVMSAPGFVAELEAFADYISDLCASRWGARR